MNDEHPQRALSDRDRYYEKELDMILQMVRQLTGAQPPAPPPQSPPLVAVERLRDLVDLHRVNEIKRLLTFPHGEPAAPPEPPSLSTSTGSSDDGGPKNKGKTMTLTTDTGVKMTLGAIAGILITGITFFSKYIEDTKKEAIRQAQMTDALERSNKALEGLMEKIKGIEKTGDSLRDELSAYQGEAARLSVAQSRLEKEVQIIKDKMDRSRSAP